MRLIEEYFYSFVANDLAVSIEMLFAIDVHDIHFRMTLENRHWISNDFESSPLEFSGQVC